MPPPPPGFETKSEPVRLRIAISGWGRTVALTKAAVAFALAIAFLVGGLKAPGTFGLTEADETARLVTGIVMAALTAWAGWAFLPPGITRRAYLELGHEALVVRHPGLFKQPFSVARQTIKAAAIDPRQWRWRWVGNKGRFHLARSAGAEDHRPEELPEWLFSVVGGSPFPVLSNVDDVPNVAFLFTEPVRLRAVRRGLRPFATKNPVHLPLHARQVRGLLVKIKDIDAGERALSHWTTVRPLTVDDVFEAEPDPAYKQKAKRRRRTANVWLTILLLLQFGAPAVAELVDRADNEAMIHSLAP